MPSADDVELRGPCPRKVVDMLDAVSTARGLTRTQLVNEILGTWARREWHVATVVGRVMNGNPQGADSGWGGLT